MNLRVRPRVNVHMQEYADFAYSSLRKKVAACKQTWRNAKWNVSVGIKQLKIAKRKVELKEKTWKCEAEGGGCSRGNFTSRKTRRMRRETASEMSSFEASLPWSQNNRKEHAAGYVLPLVFYKMPDEGSLWSYLRRKAHNNLHVFNVAARLVRSNNPINGRALTLGPRLSLFSEESY